MKFASLFAGIGGFDLGLERSGMECIAQVEWDKDCQKVLSRHWPTTPKHLDVTEVKGTDLGRPDLICGGWPCQDTSVAGGRAGLAGKRSGLFHEFMRLVAEISPTWVLAENVPGLLSSGDRRDMGTVLGALGELGYGWAYRVLDAQYLGVAQRRRRVFIVGCLGDPRRAAEVLFESESCEGHPAPRRETREEVAASVGTRAPDARNDAAGIVTHALTGVTEDGTGRGTPVVTTMRWREGKPGGGKGALLSEDRSLTLATSNDQTVFAPTAGTVTSAYGTKWNGNGSADSGDLFARTETDVRRLTPTECERLQGFPDGWTSGQSDTLRYRQLGNAVCVPVAEWIGQRIMEVTA